MKSQLPKLAVISKVSGLCFVSLFCISAKPTESDINQAKSNAFKSVKPLSLIAQPGEAGEEGNYLFDFGTANIMDSAQWDQDSRDEDALKLVLPGLKHDFVLQNQKDASITISSITWDCFCIQARIFKDGKVQRTPYKVDPGEKVTVRVAFNYYSVAAGPASSAAVLYGEDLKVPLATLTMKGVVNSGVNFSPDAGIFGEVTPAQRTSHTFTLTFDRRAPSRIPPVALRIISTNPYVKVAAHPIEQSKSGVKVEGDHILFSQGKIAELPEDLTLTFRAEVAANAPVGPLSGQIRLIVVGMPIFALVHNTVAPIRGAIVR